MCHGVPCDLPLCTFKMAGSGGVGRPKAHPVVRTDNARERAYRASHRQCERCGKPAEHLHHVDRRQNRDGRLLMLCLSCHDRIHRGLLDDGRKTA